MAEAILAQAKKLDAYLESNNVSYPSFDDDTLDQLPDELQDDRWGLANSCNELKKLARGAAMGTMDTALNVRLRFLAVQLLACLVLPPAEFLRIVDRCPWSTCRLSLQAG